MVDVEFETAVVAIKIGNRRVSLSPDQVALLRRLQESPLHWSEIARRPNTAHHIIYKLRRKLEGSKLYIGTCSSAQYVHSYELRRTNAR